MTNVIPTTENWTYDSYFGRLSTKDEIVQAVQTALSIVDDCEIEKHPFFEAATADKAYLIEWAKQECVVTNHFSLALLQFLARVKNVHIRSLLMPVIAGEHSPVKDGIAYGAHPHLISKLLNDMEISSDSIVPLPCTKKFIQLLVSKNNSVPYMLGVLAIGNEALVGPEYTAVEDAFSVHFTRNVYRPFLRSNIEEDHLHSKLMNEATLYLLRSSNDIREYLAGANESVNVRLNYYTELASYVREFAAK